MKKTILWSGALAMMAMVALTTSCQNNKKQQKEQTTTTKVEENTPKTATKTEQKSVDQAPQTEQKAEEAKKDTSKPTDKKETANKAQEKMDAAIQGIKEAGANFVSVIKNGGSSQEMTKAQKEFRASMDHAREVYKEVANSGKVDLNKASAEMTQAMNEAREKAKKAMSQR